jgi:hypothetical protein
MEFSTWHDFSKMLLTAAAQEVSPPTTAAGRSMKYQAIDPMFYASPSRPWRRTRANEDVEGLLDDPPLKRTILPQPEDVSVVGDTIDYPHVHNLSAAVNLHFQASQDAPVICRLPGCKPRVRTPCSRGKVRNACHVIQPWSSPFVLFEKGRAVNWT